MLEENMENSPTPMKELVLLQHWTHSFAFGPSSQSHMEHSCLSGGLDGFFTMSTGNLKQEENMQAI